MIAESKNSKIKLWSNWHLRLFLKFKSVCVVFGVYIFKGQKSLVKHLYYKLLSFFEIDKILTD